MLPVSFPDLSMLSAQKLKSSPNVWISKTLASFESSNYHSRGKLALQLRWPRGWTGLVGVDNGEAPTNIPTASLEHLWGTAYLPKLRYIKSEVVEVEMQLCFMQNQSIVLCTGLLWLFHKECNYFAWEPKGNLKCNKCAKRSILRYATSF